MNVTAKRLKELRQSKNYTQAYVAEYLNISRPAYVRYESGDSRPVRKIKELSELYNVSTDYILGNDIEYTKEPPKDLATFLSQTEILFDGETYHLNDEAKNKLRNALEFVFWDTKQKNKRK